MDSLTPSKGEFFRLLSFFFRRTTVQVLSALAVVASAKCESMKALRPDTVEGEGTGRRLVVDFRSCE